MTATEAAEKLTKAFNLDPPLPNKWNVIDTMAKKLGASAEAMVANKGALVQCERLGFSNGGGSIFDPAKKYPEIDSLEKAEEFMNTEEGKGVTGYSGGVASQPYAQPAPVSPMSQAIGTALGVGGLYGKIFGFPGDN